MLVRLIIQPAVILAIQLVVTILQRQVVVRIAMRLHWMLMVVQQVVSRHCIRRQVLAHGTLTAHVQQPTLQQPMLCQHVLAIHSVGSI